VHEGPEDAILRIAQEWEARHGDRGLLSNPSPMASFDRQVVTRVELQRGSRTAIERVSFTERFVPRQGGELRCSGAFQADVRVTYGSRAGEPALELEWSALEPTRQCDGSAGSLPAFSRPAGKGQFALRSDQLIGVAPVREKRVFLPAD
jgi:hypothetical protein